ncbi:Sterile alpha and TIR motif-containing protein tir-1 [Trichinella nelsoni]|uniref:ADP-ribosyl cyclase/cyclic ADP-ribose hydrolase n=1 Tax=Trichinella nelsoni TaxID=6336 RepID=A0A0V0RNC8_9BILA|nr:Sterile alpha and TIR motif-containing protein tir-1 [Trichinella nelsoni]
MIEGGRRREGWINVELCFGNLKNCPVPFLFPGQILIHFGYLDLCQAAEAREMWNVQIAIEALNSLAGQRLVVEQIMKEEIKSDACMCSMLISVPNVNSSERVRSRNVSVQTEEHRDEEVQYYCKQSLAFSLIRSDFQSVMMLILWNSSDADRMGVVRRSCIGQEEAKSASGECSSRAVVVDSTSSAESIPTLFLGSTTERGKSKQQSLVELKQKAKRKSHSVGQNSSICVAALRRPSSDGPTKACDRRRSSFSMCDIVAHCGGAGSIGSTESINELLKNAAACNGKESPLLETGPALMNQGAYDRARTVNNRRKNSIQYCMPKKLILQQHGSDDTDLEEDCSQSKEDRPITTPPPPPPPVGPLQQDSFECTANESSYGEAETEDETFTTTTEQRELVFSAIHFIINDNLRNSSADESDSFEVGESHQHQQQQQQQQQQVEQEEDQQPKEEQQHVEEKKEEEEGGEKGKSPTSSSISSGPNPPPLQSQRYSLDYSMDEEERRRQATMTASWRTQASVGSRHGSSPLASPMSIGRSMSYSVVPFGGFRQNPTGGSRSMVIGQTTPTVGGRQVGSVAAVGGGSGGGGVGGGSTIQVTKSRREPLPYGVFSDDRSSQLLFGRKGSFEYGAAKHLHTELLIYKHTLKGKLNKFQRLIDRSMSLIGIRHEESIADGCQMMSKVLKSAWTAPKIGSDLAHGLCDYVREVGYLETLVRMFIEPDSTEKIKASSGTALVECLSASNREFVVQKHYLDDLVNVAKTMKEGDGLKVSVSLFECLFKYSVDSNAKLIDLGALDHVLVACKATTCSKTLRFAALALANLSMYSDSECQQKMAQKNVPDWLFLLASSQDDLTRYYACLAICVLVSSKEIEAAVTKSGTLALVEPFLLAHKPEEFAHFDYKHQQGRSKEWLELLLPMLSAKRREPRSMAAFHFALEASVKKEQEALSLLLEIGAVDALKQVCSLPDEVAPKFATQALTIIGEEVPYKLSQQVPFWTVEDVQYWASQIGFENYSAQFAEQKVDGDLLLLLTDQELERDIGMRSGLLRKRFMRELESLKMAADYSCVDETHLDRFLVSVSPQFSVYTYQLLELGVDRSILPSLSNEILKNDCGITNPMHRMKLLQSIEECKHIDDLDIAILSKHIDIFISYRRSTGSQLASLIKVLLQLRGHKVFIDVDRLYAGNFDLSLLKNIQAAKHFILVLTPRSLDRCVGDIDCQDWVHREVKCALEHNKNLIPVFDPTFTWPEDNALPPDIRAITRFNGVRWVHEYQEACVDKLEKFISGELNVNRGFFPLPQLAPFPRQLFLNPTAGGGINVSSNSSTDFVLEKLTGCRPRGNSQ